jgi:non-specific serine/threonine protein kinase/serine/threonine-protein kinase
VALKLLLPERVDQRGLDYFAREARAGGRLSHPGIVSVYGTGSDEGLHWIAMELVDGGCDLRHSLESLREEGELPKDYYRDVAHFVAELADALEVAHTAGVIHRDLKPGNVLVTQEERPKLLDFGLAKLTDEMSISIAGDLVGTYFYMSPEQVAAKRAGLDHRTDIFSLGVMLYEMLTLVRPFEGDTTEQVANKILWDDPPSPKDIRSKVPQDLAVICGKCLEKRREVRYGSMAELAAELRRYLADEPILARPPGTVQRTAKWVRRNPTKSSLMGLGTAALVVISGLALRIADEKDKTVTALERAQVAEVNARSEAERAITAQEEEAAQRVEAEDARAEAEQRAEELQQVSDFQAEQLSTLDVPAMGQGLRAGLLDAAWKAGELAGRTTEELEKAKADLEQQVLGADFTGLALTALDEHVFVGALEALEEFENQPLVQAQLLHTLGSTLRDLGLLDRALEPQEQAVEIRKRKLGDEHPDTLLSINGLGDLLYAQGRLDEAEPLMQETLEISRRLLGDEHPRTLDAVLNLGALFSARGKLDKAEPLYREALEGHRRTLGGDHPSTLQSTNNLGFLLKKQGKLNEAESLYRKTLEGRRRTLGDDHPNTLVSINNLGALLKAQGKLDEAESFYREALEGLRRMLGNEHPSTLTSTNNLGLLLMKQGKLDESEPLLREVLEGRRRALDKEHPDILQSLNNMGSLLYAQGHPAQAEPFFREALQGLRRRLGEEHTYTLTLINNLGLLLMGQDKLEEAGALLREALRVRRRMLGNEHPSTLLSINNLGRLCQEQDKLDEAERFYRESMNRRRTILGDKHPDTLISIHNLASLLKELGKLEEAETLARETVEFTKQDSPELAKHKALLKEILALQASESDTPTKQTRESDDG